MCNFQSLYAETRSSYQPNKISQNLSGSFKSVNISTYRVTIKKGKTTLKNQTLILSNQMAEESSKLATARTVLSTVASVAATAMVARSVIRDYLPYELQDSMFMGMRRFFYRFSNELTMVIEEFDGLVNNEIYEAAECYLGSKITPSTRRLKISKPEKEKNFNITMEKDEKILDIYNGEKLKWVWIVNKIQSISGSSFYNPRDMNSTLKSEVRSFELTFHKKNKDMVINSYLPHIIREAKSMKHKKKTLKIHTIDPDQMYDIKNAWTSMNLDHPATFDTLAMDSDQKDVVRKDLEMFVKRRDYYRQVGKAWKRGYLLYGPPGTGKSSLIAAMANFLNFDIYDLELTEIRRNTELRKLLLATANKSILVVEDIDCSIDLQNRKNKRSRRRFPDMDFFNQDQNKVTLSGFLNFVDGLWSSSGDERIIIFTTNHKEKLDPALLRPGRMDLHIHMSYCTPSGFRILADNYLGLKHHNLFKDIEDLIVTTNVTPAEVAEQLLKQNEPESSLQSLIDFIHESKRRKETEKEEEEKEEARQQEGENLDEQAEEVNSKLKNQRGGGGESVQDMKELITVEVAKNLGKILGGLIKDLVEMQTKENGEIKVKEEENSSRNTNPVSC